MDLGLTITSVSQKDPRVRGMRLCFPLCFHLESHPEIMKRTINSNKKSTLY